MAVPLLLSSIAAGLIATSVMVFFLYLPLVWRGNYYDVLGALGSALTHRIDAQARFLGALIYFGGGIFVAIFYGWVVLALMQGGFVPQLNVFEGLPTKINLVYPFLGAALGLGHGILVAFFVVIIVIEHHPLEQYRARFILVISQLISHIVFGVTVMFFQSQFLQLLT